jgi:two-component system phosphate regulon sensor histidine kinase PhoR
MTLDPTPPLTPAARRGLGWIAPLSGAAGVALLLLLAWTDPVHPGRTLLAAFVLTGVTIALTLRADRLLRQARQAEERDTGTVVASQAPSSRAAFDALPDPLMVIEATEPDDIAGRRVILANLASRDLFRMEAEGALLVTAMRDPDVLEAVDEALFGGVERVTAFALAGAQDRQWRAFARPLPGEGMARRALLHLRDETELHAMEQMRVDFLANASHELRSPLSSLIGFIETLKGPARDDAAARDRFLDIMATQADRMGRLISELLALSRIELNEHIQPMGSADLALVAGDVIDSVTPVLGERDVRIRLSGVEGGRARVAGDRDQIVQVVQNLVDNALKYAPRGSSVKIALASGLTAEAAAAPLRPQASRLSLLTPDHGQGLYAVLRVSDEGLGLKREHLPRLTERFYRVEGQKSGERSGTGLGLAIVKHIMNRHRGGLAVESVEGEGATFSAYFPLAEQAVSLAQTPRPEAVTKPS